MRKPPSVPESEWLTQVSVRLMREEERERFDDLLETQHYIHSARLGGPSLRYVAEAEGQWVGALISFSGAAPQSKAREMKIRWTPRQRARRLCWVVNNSRFLLLPERARYPNLASRVLGLCLKRLSADWQAQWGHPVLLAESYCTSAALQQYGAPQLLGFIRDHWAAIENGAHHRRDVSLGEDASKISGRTGAYVMATLRNLVLGLFELQKHRGRTPARTFPSWRRQLTHPHKIALITRNK